MDTRTIRHIDRSDSPWSDARSYEESEGVEDMEPGAAIMAFVVLWMHEHGQRIVGGLCLAIVVFCAVYFGGHELLAVVR